ncbi:MAG: bifunctional alpha,alpha-trehalose-phosphate synthase (UDP-forming)/trehalose-phosphatase [Terriglobia bacterium]
MKLVIVSNRLPVSLREEQGRWEFTESPGGLASGLRAYLRSGEVRGSDYVWVGWPGTEVPGEFQAEVANRCQEEFSARPVFLSRAETEAFYEGFCNNTLWPLFHYFLSKVDYDEGSWASYERVNQAFCDTVMEVARPGDLVWVHDYQLLLLPALLKQKLFGVRVGFFLHIPFPSYEIFRLLPDRWRAALLNGMLGADLVGFHTHDYSQYFLKCVRRILGQEHEMGQVFLRDRVVKVDTFPMGIDFNFFSRKATEAEVVRQRDELRLPFGQAKIILSIDRLDYTKGIADRLLAYQAFLESSPSWHARVVFLLLLVPSRTGVEEYQRMKARIDELVGGINGRFGTLSWTPVIYQYKSLRQEELVPLYSASEVMLITPLRDGMNLVAKEYVACQPGGTGALVLSERAGAASELGEALIINPNDVQAVARALQTALEMPADVQRKSMLAMRQRLQRYDVVRWASDFLEALKENRSRFERRLLTAALREQILKDFRAAERRLLLCDYDGTLVPFKPTPEAASPDQELLVTLDRLGKISDLVLVSGRPRTTLDAWFGHLDVVLVAEHGAWMRERKQDWVSAGVLSDDWKPGIRDVMERYVDRLPGAFVEEKEFSLAWHYRRAERDLAALRSRELADHLIGLTEKGDLKVMEGSKVIEVKPASIGKGTCCQTFLARGHGFVLAMGDDATDEDLFKVLPESAYSIRVGLTSTYARFNVYNEVQARELLEAMAGSE